MTGSLRFVAAMECAFWVDGTTDFYAAAALSDSLKHLSGNKTCCPASLNLVLPPPRL
jgi:hypothetical protein